MSFQPGRPHWWQWPTILSLDAAVVTVSWQMLFARAINAPLAVYHVSLLAASVWLSYAADRWIEGWRLSPSAVRTQRHYFAIRWRWPLLAAWLTVLAASLVTAGLCFDAREWVVSLWLLAPTLLYLLSHQFLHRHHPLRVPKEICVAAILALGAALYPALQAPGGWKDAAAPALLFFSLALTDVLLISEWERDVDVAQNQTSIALRYRRGPLVSRALLSAIFVSGAAFAALHHGFARRVGECGALSAALLALLTAAQPRIGRERARVLVDIALMTPFLALVLP